MLGTVLLIVVTADQSCAQRISGKCFVFPIFIERQVSHLALHKLDELIVFLLEHGNEFLLREVTLSDLVRRVLVAQGVRPVFSKLPSRPNSSNLMLLVALEFLYRLRAVGVVIAVLDSGPALHHLCLSAAYEVLSADRDLELLVVLVVWPSLKFL